MRNLLTNGVDAAAVSLSGLCVCHCLLFGIAALSLPALSILGAEWVHQAFVIAAIPISGIAIGQSLSADRGWFFALLASLGLVLLFVAAFYEPFHDYEIPMTIGGAITLASAHLWFRPGRA